MKNSTTIKIEPCDNERLNILCGNLDHNLQIIEKHFNSTISRRGNIFSITADDSNNLINTEKTLYFLYKKSIDNKNIDSTYVNTILAREQALSNDELDNKTATIKTKYKFIKAKTANQAKYMNNIQKYDINFALGPAGTGKTYLAVACAIAALNNGEIKRLIFIRPAVEAGEKLGFLPGDMVEKVNPYLRPLYDALYDMLGNESVEKMLQNNTIEIAPLAFMRGRTLSDAFVILDEAQNTTIDQMKMFLTRMGFGSKMVITGDVTQIDLKYGVRSGLIHARDILSAVKGIKFNAFSSKDIIRHKLVQNIIQAYDEHGS